MSKDESICGICGRKWEKTQSTRQASVFTKENLLSYLKLENTTYTLVRKVHAVLSTVCSGRNIEMISFSKHSIKKDTDNRKPVYLLLLDKAKVSGTVISSWCRENTVIVSGQLEVQIIDDYII